MRAGESEMGKILIVKVISISCFDNLLFKASNNRKKL